jgi:predicted CopG family antitoxin
MQRRITVGLRNDVYTRLRDKGKFGESFSELILRLIQESERRTKSTDTNVEVGP